MNKTKSLATSLKLFAFETCPLAVVVLAVLAALPAPALDWSNAQIQSGTIIGGTESRTDGSKVTTIFQSSGKGIIDWGSAGNAADAGFKLAVNEALNLFNGTSGTTLMRDVTGQASKILGAINTSGSIWVVNKAGVFIGSSAAIDVGKQFLAVAGDISDTDFLNGTFNFTDVSGEVWNVGSIKAGDDVILVGAKVVNQGRIQAADQLAVGGFKTGEAGTLAMNVGGGKITFTVTSDATAGTVVNEGILENAAYAAQDMTPTADISGLTGKFNATTDLTDGTYSVADGKITYTLDGNWKTLTPATLGTADMPLGTYTAVRIQAQETIASLQGQGQVNASILAMESATIKQSDTAESSPLDLGIGVGGDGTLTAAKDATIKATGGELAIGDANIAKTAVIEAAGEVSVGHLQGSSVSLKGTTVATGAITAGQNVAIEAANGITATGDITAEDGSVALLGSNPDSALTLGAGATVAASGDVFLKGGSLTMNATGAGSEIRAGGNTVISVGGNAALDRVVSENGNIAVAAGGDILDAQGDETTIDTTGHATLAGGENLVAENGAVSLAAGGIIGAATARDSSGRAVLPVDALEVKAQKISARAGGDLALQSSGDFTIGTVEAIAASGLPLIEGSEGTTHGAQSGIVAGGTANLAAAGEIRDDTGDETDVTAQKAVFTAGVGAGRDDALEIAVSGTGKNILWGNSVSGVSGGSVPMSVFLAGGNTRPDAGSLPDSNVRWQIDNGLNEGSESVDDRVSGHIQCAAHSIFDDLPLTIQPHEVYMPFTFLSLDLGLMPSAGEGFIDYLRPVERRTEPENLCQ